MGAEDDYIGFSLTIFTTSLTLLLGLYILLQLYAVPELQTETAANILNGLKAFDSLMIMFVMCIFIVTMILTYYLPANPLFFFTIILIGIIATIFTPYMTNMYIDVATNPILQSTADQLPVTNNIMQNLPLITFINMLINALVMYSKNPFQIQGGGVSGLE